MTKNKITLICKGVKFYSYQDENAFFEWIKKINCIKSFFAIKDELHLDIISNPLPDEELRNLLAFFYRYKINMKQLQQFLNQDNKDWFKEGTKGYWHKRVFNNS